MKEKIGALGLISLVIALLGVILPIGWDYYSGQRGVSLTLMSQSELISASSGVEGIDISYKGTKLTALSKMVFLVENTGNKPILKSDIVSPVTISVPDRVNILDALVESKSPADLEISAIPGKQRLTLDFSLLNPGDKAYVSMLIDSVDVNFSATARIAGVKNLSVNHEPPKTFSVWALLWVPVGFISLLLLIVSFVGFCSYPKEFKTKRAIKKGTLSMPDLYDYKEIHKWVKDTTSFITRDERKPIIVLLNMLESNGATIDKDKILKSVIDAVIGCTNNLIVALIVFVVGLFGFYYSLSSLGYL